MTACPQCGGQNFYKSGVRQRKTAAVQKYHCVFCGRDFSGSYKIHQKSHVARPRRDLLSSESPASEAQLLYEACIAANQNFEAFAETIECTELELAQFDFLIGHGILHESKVAELIARRREIRKLFEALVAGEKLEAKSQVSPPVPGHVTVSRFLESWDAQHRKAKVTQ